MLPLSTKKSFWHMKKKKKKKKKKPFLLQPKPASQPRTASTHPRKEVNKQSGTDRSRRRFFSRMKPWSELFFFFLMPHWLLTAGNLPWRKTQELPPKYTRTQEEEEESASFFRSSEFGNAFYYLFPIFSVSLWLSFSSFLCSFPLNTSRVVLLLLQQLLL